MISVNGLSKHFPGEQSVHAVDQVCFALEESRFLAIVGRSGSGKSTLLAMVGGICRPTAGSIVVGGSDIWRLDENARADFRNRSIGFVFQFASLLPTLRAIDNVALPALVSGALDDRQAYARARALLERVGLASRSDNYPGQLSGGEQRRVAIARALVNAPSLLLADEPTADLDEETEAEILDLLIDIQRALALTLVVVTHNPQIAERADQILEMRAGRATAARTRPQVLAPLVMAGAGLATRTVEAVGAGSERLANLAETVAACPAQASDMSAGSLNAGTVMKIGGGGSPDIMPVGDVYAIPAHVSSREKIRLGEGIERFIGRLVLLVIPILVAAWGLNAAVAAYQRHVLQAEEEQRLALEELAMKGLRAEVKDVTLGPGKTYLLSIYLRNTTGEQPIYVMSPTVRAFVQVGTSWQEVPLKQADASMAQVLKITGDQVYQFILEPDVQDFAKLIPCYMHVRIANDMLISPRSQPKEDLIERNDNYYVYLKPHDADDSVILSRLKFPGKPPVWIPMPPH